MEITDARVRLMNDSSDRLKAFCSITFDNEFVIRDLKIVDGATGLFVAMPSRKNTVSCPDCRHKNVVRSRYCNECGAELPSHPPQPVDNGRGKSHRDIAHPITTEFREYVQKTVLAAYKQELKLAAAPDYEPKELDDEPLEEEEEELIEAPMARRPGDSRGGRADRGERKQESVDYVNDYDALIANLKGGGTRDREPSATSEVRRPAPPRSGQSGQRPPQKSRPPQPRDQRGRSGGPPRDARREQAPREAYDTREPRDHRGSGRETARPPRTGAPQGERSAYRPVAAPLEEPAPAAAAAFAAPVAIETAPYPAREPLPPSRPATPETRPGQPASAAEPAEDADDTPFGIGVL